MRIKKSFKKLESWARRVPPYAAMLAIMAIAVVLAFAIPHGRNHELGGAQNAADGSITSGGTVMGDAQAEGELQVDPTPDVFIQVNIPATELSLYEDGVLLFRRPIAIGRGIYPTPQQVSSIKKIEWNPWWYPPDAAWAKNDKPTPPGPSNPLGLVKMPLAQEILFHGTNAAWSVGRAASHGCLRMHNRDVTELAWYLQKRFSEEIDPKLRDEYRKYRWKTFRVLLNKPVPVELVYRPVVARDGQLTFHRDHYNRVAGKRKAAIITELLRAGYEIDGVDDTKIDSLSRSWPIGDEVLINKLMREKKDSTIKHWPECS